MLNKLFIERTGSLTTSIMKTNHLVTKVMPNRPHKFLWANLHEIGEMCEGKVKSLTTEVIKPESVKINYKISNEKVEDCNQHNNIFNKNSIITLDTKEINIPIVNGTKSNLAYYSCQLLHMNDIFIFEALKERKSQLPLFEMFIGKDYIEHYIMNKSLGGGVYLEYHDNPHFHSPCNKSSKGFLTIGKKYDDYLELTGFKIPYGTGVYMPPYTLHNDCFLIGHWNVVYDDSKDFFTGLLRTEDNELVNFNEKIENST